MVERIEGEVEGGEEIREPGPDDSPTDREGVLTLVCLECGTEYYFSGLEGAPAELQCEKCGGHVFREFSSVRDDEVARDFQDVTARDLDPDDAEGDAMPGDVLDLNRD